MINSNFILIAYKRVAIVSTEASLNTLITQHSLDALRDQVKVMSADSVGNYMYFASMAAKQLTLQDLFEFSLTVQDSAIKEYLLEQVSARGKLEDGSFWHSAQLHLGLLNL
ncbi:MAG: hypothetical protein O3A01_04740 [bacterium]|nr:hypothetical protein [bacterium]